MKTTSPSGASGRLGPFQSRPFLIYWSGGLLSNIGTWLQSVAASVYVYLVTGDVFAVGVLNFAAYLPIVLFSVLGGNLADRRDRRIVVIVASAVSLVIALVLAVLVATGAAGAPHVIVAAFLLNTSYALAKPAMVAIVPSLVPPDRLADAVGMNSLQFIAGQIIGPVIAATLLAVADASVAFFVNALTFVGPIATMAYLLAIGRGATQVQGGGAAAAAGGPGPERATHPARVATPRPGMRALLAAHPWVPAILVTIVACSAPLEVMRTLSPAYVAEGLGAPENTAGVIVSAMSVGSALAVLGFMPLRRRFAPRVLIVAGAAVQAAGLALSSVAPDLVVAAIGSGMIGCGFSLAFPLLTSILQAGVADDERGRAMGLHQIAFLGNRPAVALIAGGGAALIGVQPAVLLGLLAVPIGLLLTGALRRELPASSPLAAAPRLLQEGHS